MHLVSFINRALTSLTIILRIDQNSQFFSVLAAILLFVKCVNIEKNFNRGTYRRWIRSFLSYGNPMWSRTSLPTSKPNSPIAISNTQNHGLIWSILQI